MNHFCGTISHQTLLQIAHLSLSRNLNVPFLIFDYFCHHYKPIYTCLPVGMFTCVWSTNTYILTFLAEIKSFQFQKSIQIRHGENLSRSLFSTVSRDLAAFFSIICTTKLWAEPRHQSWKLLLPLVWLLDGGWIFVGKYFNSVCVSACIDSQTWVSPGPDFYPPQNNRVGKLTSK